MLDEKIENITKSERNFAPNFVGHHALLDVNFNGKRLIINDISTPQNVINLYISYILVPWIRNLNADFTLKIA